MKLTTLFCGLVAVVSAVVASVAGVSDVNAITVRLGTTRHLPVAARP